MDSTFDLLTLALLPGVQPRTVREARRRGPLAALLSRPEAHQDLISAAALERLRSGRARRHAEQESDRARSLGVVIVGLDEPGYPDLLRETFDPPAVLYVKGHLRPAEGKSCVALVGSRAATPAGAALARSMAADLAREGATVVSGLARGIDSAAHRGALDASGRTLAVLGSGLDKPYPPENAALCAAIAESGAVVSELPLGSPPAPRHFPRRNRIIAGWGMGVVVVEAAEKSGALITAGLALECGREVMAVPGHPAWPGARGANALIRDGARLVRHAEDVALELGFDWPRRAVPGAGSPAARGLLAELRVDRPVTLEELCEKSGRPLTQLLAELTELELEARVRRLPGPLFLRN